MLLARVEQLQSRSVPPAPLPPMGPERADGLMAQARTLEETGEDLAAIAAFKRAAAAPSRAGAALCECGRLQRRRGEREEALTTFKHALHHIEDPVWIAWVYAQMGQVYFSMREDEEANYYFRRAASLDRRHDHLLERTASVATPDLYSLDTADIELTTLQ